MIYENGQRMKRPRSSQASSWRKCLFVGLCALSVIVYRFLLFVATKNVQTNESAHAISNINSNQLDQYQKVLSTIDSEIDKSDSLYSWLEEHHLQQYDSRLKDDGHIHTLRTLEEVVHGGMLESILTNSLSLRKVEINRFKEACKAFGYGNDSAIETQNRHTARHSSKPVIQTKPALQVPLKVETKIDQKSVKVAMANDQNNNNKHTAVIDNYATFPPEVSESLLRWDGVFHRGTDQHVLNLIQGMYDTLKNPWLKSFASRDKPLQCSQSPSSDVKKILFVHFEQGINTELELSKVVEQAEKGTTCMITSDQGPFQSCEELLVKKGCFSDVLPRSTCINVENLGPICYSSAKHGKGSMLVWPRNQVGSGVMSTRSASFVFNQFMHELMDDSCTNPQCLRNVLGGSSKTPMVVCLTKATTLPINHAYEDMPTESGLSFNDWVNRAAKLLQHNYRLATVGCYPKFAGHTYVDTLEYYNVPLK